MQCLFYTNVQLILTSSYSFLILILQVQLSMVISSSQPLSQPSTWPSREVEWIIQMPLTFFAVTTTKRRPTTSLWPATNGRYYVLKWTHNLCWTNGTLLTQDTPHTWTACQCFKHAAYAVITSIRHYILQHNNDNNYCSPLNTLHCRCKECTGSIVALIHIPQAE